MAYYGSPDEENLDENRDQEANTLSGPASFSGGGGGGSGQAQTGANSSTPSRFVSFDRYYNANAGAANSMADKALSGVTEQINAANSGLKSEQDAFGTAVRDGIDSPVIDGGANLSYFSTPGTYKGPKEFVPSQGVRDNLTNAYSSLQNLRTPEGLQNALPKAGTSGNDRFNAYLTSQAGQSRFDNLWNQYSNMGTAVDDAMTQGQQTVDAAIDTNRERNIKAREIAEMYTNSTQQELADAEQDNQEADEQIERSGGGKEREPKRRRSIYSD